MLHIHNNICDGGSGSRTQYISIFSKIQLYELKRSQNNKIQLYEAKLEQHLPNHDS